MVRLLCINWVVRRVFFESSLKGQSTMHKCYVLEDNVVLFFLLNLDDRPIVANNVDFLLRVLLLYDQAWLTDRVLDGVDTL